MRQASALATHLSHPTNTTIPPPFPPPTTHTHTHLAYPRTGIPALGFAAACRGADILPTRLHAVRGHVCAVVSAHASVLRGGLLKERVKEQNPQC